MGINSVWNRRTTSQLTQCSKIRFGSGDVSAKMQLLNRIRDKKISKKSRKCTDVHKLLWWLHRLTFAEISGLESVSNSDFGCFQLVLVILARFESSWKSMVQVQFLRGSKAFRDRVRPLKNPCKSRILTVSEIAPTFAGFMESALPRSWYGDSFSFASASIFQIVPNRFLLFLKAHSTQYLRFFTFSAYFHSCAPTPLDFVLKNLKKRFFACTCGPLPTASRAKIN